MFPSMSDLQQLAATRGADVTLRGLTLKAIYTAVVAGNVTTAAVSGTGPSSEEKQQMFKDLQAQGLTVTNSGSTFTVGWGSIS